MSRDDRGSTIPLILGFFLIALLVVAGSVALADTFVQQRDLQDVCDGAAAAAAATAVDLGRGSDGTDLHTLSFQDAHAVEAAVTRYLGRDPDRRGVRVSATVSTDRATLTLHCRQERTIAFGAVFGSPEITHTATASARAPLSAQP